MERLLFRCPDISRGLGVAQWWSAHRACTRFGSRPLKNKKHSHFPQVSQPAPNLLYVTFPQLYFYFPGNLWMCQPVIHIYFFCVPPHSLLPGSLGASISHAPMPSVLFGLLIWQKETCHPSFGIGDEVLFFPWDFYSMCLLLGNLSQAFKCHIWKELELIAWYHQLVLKCFETSLFLCFHGGTAGPSVYSWLSLGFAVVAGVVVGVGTPTWEGNVVALV